MSSRLIVNSIRHTGASSDAITLDSAGKCSFPNGGAGKILQVIQAVKTDTTSTSSSTHSAISGLQPSITPNSTSNKILISINLKIGITHEYGDNNFKLYRSIGGTETEIFSGDAAGNRTVGFFGQQDTNGDRGEYIVLPLSSQYLDSPNTTSAVTYIVKWRGTRSSTTLYLNRQGEDGDDVGNHRSSSSIILMEVGA